MNESMTIFKRRMIGFLICFSFVACLVTLSVFAFDGEPRPELLRNPSFDNGVENWNCYSCGTAQVIGERDTVDYDTAPASYRIQCINKGETTNNIQLFTMPLNLIKDKVYLFTFKAKSTYELKIPSIQLMKATNPWTLYAEPYSGLTISNWWQTYTVVFKANITASDGRITFFLGNALPNGAIFHIDTLSLKETMVNPPITGEVLPNPGFDMGSRSWSFYCGNSAESYGYLDSTDFDSSPLSYRIQCVNSGSSMNDIQLFTMSINIEQNKKYQLTFKAKCSTGSVIPSIRLMKATSPWTLYDWPCSGLIVGNDWQSYSYIFTANKTATDGRITFFLGNALPSGSVLWIDSVSLRDFTPPTPTLTVTPTPIDTPTSSPTPTATPGIAVPMVAAGEYHSLALKSDGTVWAWGCNGNGQLGNGTYTNSSSPVQVYGLTNVKRIAAGGRLSLAVKTDGSVWVWGYNGYGIGNGMTQSSYATQVPGLTDIEDITVGTRDADSNLSYGENGKSCYVIALKKDGTVWAWGNNSYGYLGDGTTVYKPTPVQVFRLMDIMAISTWYGHTLALKKDGTVWAWGENYWGELGIRSTNFSYVPVQVSLISNVVSISAGTWFSIARDRNGVVWAWGCNGFVNYSNFGNGCTTGSLAPTQISNLEGFTNILSGYCCGLGLKTDGTGWSWGYNGYGQLGDGTTVNKLVPVEIIGLNGIICFAAGYQFTLAVMDDGTVWSWGINVYGQLGDDTVSNRYSAVRVQGLNLK